MRPRLVIFLIFIVLCVLSLLFIRRTDKPKSTIEAQEEASLSLLEWEFNRIKNPSTNTIPSGALMEVLNERNQNLQLVNATNKKFEFGWYPVNDFFATLSVTRLVYDPLNTKTFYFCTGEGWGNVDAARGAGIWKSMDGGSSWNQLSSTKDTSLFHNCQDMDVHPLTGDIYVATWEGLVRSKDGGTSWEKVLTDTAGTVINRITDIEFTSAGDIFIGTGIFTGGTIYFSETGNKGDWERQTNGFPASGLNRVEIATAPSNEDVAYAIPLNSGSLRIQGVYRTRDKGKTWVEVGNPGGVYDLAKVQGWYNLVIKVDPNDENVVVAGGLDLWKSIDGGDSWNRITEGFSHPTGKRPTVHVDQHEILFLDSKTAYFCNDGGLYRSKDFNEEWPAFETRNYGYNVTQFYAGAIHPEQGNPFVMGGTQDNGTVGSDEPGAGEFRALSGADGSFCAIDFEDPTFAYTTTQFRRFYRIDITEDEIVFDTLTNPYLANNNLLFINPFEMDPNDPQLLYQLSNRGLWRLKNARTANDSDWTQACRQQGRFSSIGITTNPPNHVFLGKDNGGRIWRIDGADTTDQKYRIISVDKNGQLPSAYSSNIYVNPKDGNHVIATYSNYGTESVFESKNALSDSTTWVSHEGNLPDIPVRWSLLHPTDSLVCYIGTELGVYYTDKLNGDSTVWNTSNVGLANLRIDMLRLRKSDNTVLAVTHGRGLFTAQIDVNSTDHELVWTERGPNNIGGRTRTIMQDPNDPSGKTFWAGSVSGGLWKTNNIDWVDSLETALNFQVAIKPIVFSVTGTYLCYELEQNEQVKIKIYTLEGKSVSTLLDQAKGPGIYNIKWTTDNLPAGIYLINFSTSNFTKTERVIKIK